MATSITAHLVRGMSYREDDKSGTFNEVWRVDGLASNSGIASDALNASDAANVMPRAGQQHAKMPDFVLRAVSVDPVAGSKTAVNVTLMYAKVRRRLLDVRLNGVSIQGTTQRDSDGKILVVGYKGPSTIGGTTTTPGTAFPDPKPTDKGGSGYTYNYAPKVPVPIPQNVLEIDYLEKGSPKKKWKRYGRRLNSKPWQDGAAREWFCEAITGRIDSPIPLNLADLPDQMVVRGAALFNWIVTYRFIQRELPAAGTGNLGQDSWDPLLIFVDQNTLRSPNDIDPVGGGWPSQIKGNGWYVPKILGEADFNELDLVQCFVEAP